MSFKHLQDTGSELANAIEKFLRSSCFSNLAQRLRYQLRLLCPKDSGHLLLNHIISINSNFFVGNFHGFCVES